jgi:very-short-patch-repair endonuclease
LKLNEARLLRRNMSNVEWLLWSRLRFRQLDGHKFRRQAPIGPFVVDFACLRQRLLIEVDGRDAHDFRQERDAARQTWLESEGYRVLRFPAINITQRLDEVVETILLALRRQLDPTLPSPPSGEGTEGRRRACSDRW